MFEAPEQCFSGSDNGWARRTLLERRKQCSTAANIEKRKPAGSETFRRPNRLPLWMLTAFEDTPHRYQPRGYSFPRYLLSSREEAEDVTQEVLLRLWRHRDGVDEERLGAWLLRVTRNACYDLLRKRRSEAAAGLRGPRLDDEEPGPGGGAEPGA